MKMQIRNLAKPGVTATRVTVHLRPACSLIKTNRSLKACLRDTKLGRVGVSLQTREIDLTKSTSFRSSRTSRR